MGRRFVLLLMAGSLGAAASDARSDRDRLQGSWACVAMERNGRPVPAERYRDGRLVMDGETFTVLQGGRLVAQGIRRLDPTATPKAVDDTHTSGPFKGKTYRGIYRLQGDTFTTCNGSAGQARPTEFATRPGSGLLLVVYRRESP
jgi:uncharacterized protein (TIGR03067 family)